MHWLLNKWVLGGIGIFLALIGAFWKGYGAGKESVQAEWNKERLAHSQALTEAIQKGRDTERQMQSQADKFQTEKRNEIDRITRQHRAVVDSLRNRPERPASPVSGSAGTPQGQSGCTGVGLHREDAEFLIGEAARADKIRAELEACYIQYDNIRNMMGR